MTGILSAIHLNILYSREQIVGARLTNKYKLRRHTPARQAKTGTKWKCLAFVGISNECLGVKDMEIG